ncbi:polysaccharide deacetylase family protein [Streptomyces sp. NPDC002553]|uniref:polysaccharide deacetylase family protein n=1 Tax=Streptomyces sp. NPDC002553 TaxID=3154417 RepID=UPI00332C8E0E
MRHRGRPSAPAPARAAALIAAAVLSACALTACAPAGEPVAGPAATRARSAHAPATDEPPYRRWGLPSPLAPAPAPARPKPPPRRALPPVLDRVTTSDRVVFLTYDDGAERDPRFVDMVRELRLPVSVFVTDSVAGPAYAHFARLREVGADLQNHTLDHAALRGLPYAGQRAEICGQQNKLNARFGVRPRLFRPPYGAYDTTTRRAAADCGITAIVLWRTPTGPHRLHPGDILATTPDRTPDLLRQIQQQHLTVGKLEDYL